jgi:Spy/CpxP family protein refolding chaperone
MKPMRDATEEDRKAFREAQQQKEASFKTILTADQFQQYLKLKEEMRSKMRERAGGANESSTGD